MIGICRSAFYRSLALWMCCCLFRIYCGFCRCLLPLLFFRLYSSRVGIKNLPSIFLLIESCVSLLIFFLFLTSNVYFRLFFCLIFIYVLFAIFHWFLCIHFQHNCVRFIGSCVIRLDKLSWKRGFVHFTRLSFWSIVKEMPFWLRNVHCLEQNGWPHPLELNRTQILNNKSRRQIDLKLRINETNNWRKTQRRICLPRKITIGHAWRADGKCGAKNTQTPTCKKFTLTKSHASKIYLRKG